MEEKIFERPLEEQLCFEVYKASISFAKMYMRALKKYELTFPQYLVLLALWDREEVRIKEVQERLNVSIGTLNPILNRMETEGWVQKRKDPHDKRASMVSLTKRAVGEKRNISRSIKEELDDCQVEGIDFQNLFLNLKYLNQELDVLEEKHLEEKQVMK